MRRRRQRAFAARLTPCRCRSPAMYSSSAASFFTGAVFQRRVLWLNQQRENICTWPKRLLPVLAMKSEWYKVEMHGLGWSGGAWLGLVVCKRGTEKRFPFLSSNFVSFTCALCQVSCFNLIHVLSFRWFCTDSDFFREIFVGLSRWRRDTEIGIELRYPRPLFQSETDKSNRCCVLVLWFFFIEVNFHIFLYGQFIQILLILFDVEVQMLYHFEI